MVILLGFMAITGFLSAFVRLGARIGAGARCLDFIRHPEDPQAGRDSRQARPMLARQPMIKPYDAQAKGSRSTRSS